MELVNENLRDVSKPIRMQGKVAYHVVIPEVVCIALQLRSLAVATCITHTPQNASREWLDRGSLSDFRKPAVTFPTLPVFPLPLFLEVLERWAVEICSVMVGWHEAGRFSRETLRI